LGSFTNIKIARDAVCDLILGIFRATFNLTDLGSPPGKVYAKLRIVANRIKERM
jgi:RNA-binding protein PNO1